MRLIEALLVFGLLLVVGPAIQLHPSFNRRWSPVLVGAVVAACFSLQGLQPGLRVAFAAPWLVLTLAVAALAAWRWLAQDRSLEGLVWPASVGYLAVGAVWLLLHALRLEPVGVRPPFVLLTAVHFHYAGFVSTLLAALVRARTAAASPRASGVMAAAVVVAPPVVALGFTFVGVLQVVGAVVLTVGLLLLAVLTLRHVVPSTPDRVARILLVVSSVSVIVPMLLAVQWAVGWNYGTPALSIPLMARTHGVLNAVGFAFCGVWAWRRSVVGTVPKEERHD